MGMTLAQKILARASGRAKVKPGEYVTANIDVAMVHNAWSSIIPILNEVGIKKVWDTKRVVSLLDHYTPAPNVTAAEAHKKIEDAIKSLKIANYYGQSAGVCHQVLLEKGHVVPGELIVGTDSHTTTYGSFGAAGTGIGVSEMAYVLTTGKLWFRVPETIEFILKGSLSDKIMSKDIILYIAGKYSSSVAQYRAVEFSGPVADKMSIASRMTMSNMAMEIGAKFAFFAADEKLKEYLTRRTQKPVNLISSDKDAVYQNKYEIEVSSLEPQVAFPYTVDNVKSISEAQGIKIDQVVLGSCTNGRTEDLSIAAEILKGKKVSPYTRLLVAPASAEVFKDIAADGTLSILIDAGAIICPAGCGSCFGSHMGLLAAGESCIASINRNFKGRMGSSEAKVYLASPATVAASAIEGKIADPRKY